VNRERRTNDRLAVIAAEVALEYNDGATRGFLRPG
jgi:hypothetical protein